MKTNQKNPKNLQPQNTETHPPPKNKPQIKLIILLVNFVSCLDFFGGFFD